MNLMRNETPYEGQTVIIYFAEGQYSICKYIEVWGLKDWRPAKRMIFRTTGRHPQRVPMKKVMGWNRIPQNYETLGGTGHVDHEAELDDMVCGWKNSINPIDCELYKDIMWKVTKKHHRVLSFTDNEFFAMVRMIKKHFINKEETND